MHVKGFLSRYFQRINILYLSLFLEKTLSTFYKQTTSSQLKSTTVKYGFIKSKISSYTNFILYKTSSSHKPSLGGYDVYFRNRIEVYFHGIYAI